MTLTFDEWYAANMPGYPRDAWDAAVAATREECAMIADIHSCGVDIGCVGPVTFTSTATCECQKQIASAIRELGKEDGDDAC